MQLDALLVEYASLRDEVLQRATMIAQIWTVAATATVAIIGVALSGRFVVPILSLLPLVLFLLVVGIRFVELDTRRIVDRLLDIERSVNAIVGVDVMIWETKYGMKAMGALPRWKSVFRINSD